MILYIYIERERGERLYINDYKWQTTQHFVGPNPSPFARKNPQTLPRARLLHGLLDCLHGGELFVHLLLLNRGEKKGELGFWGPVHSNTWDCLLPKPCETMEVWLPKAFEHLGLSMVEDSARASTCVNIIISLRIDDLVVFFTSS